MNCPLCHAELIVADKQGIEIDHCPACRGVWLDRGELEKLIAKAAPLSTGGNAGDRASYDDDSDVFPRGQHQPRGDYSKQPPKKRGSFLSELFDFG